MSNDLVNVQVKVVENATVDNPFPVTKSWLGYSYGVAVRYQFVIGVALGALATVTGQTLYSQYTAPTNKKCVF